MVCEPNPSRLDINDNCNCIENYEEDMTTGIYQNWCKCLSPHRDKFNNCECKIGYREFNPVRIYCECEYGYY